MANRKARPIEGEVCWFCKQPADHESWMGLGFLKSTSQPVFEGNYILYHEPCAVYSNGAGNVPADGMDDETVYKFWFHGEKCSGIGFKCQLCGLKGATTGCLDEPCQQFYHYPCARVRAAQGHLQFSLQCRAMACSKHLDMLPLPAEDQFLGMWMEGGGSWNGSLVAEAAASWLPHYEGYLAAFKSRWHHLLTMTPAGELRAAAAQSKGKAKAKPKRRSRTGGDDSDPDFRVKRSGRSSNTGARRASQSQLGRGNSLPDGQALPPGQPPPQQQQQQQQLQPQMPWAGMVPAGMMPAHAGGAPYGADALQGFDVEMYAAERPADGQAAAGEAQPWPELDCGLLLQAAGFGAPVAGQTAQQGGVQRSEQALQAVAAAAGAAGGDHGATSSRTASGVARGSGGGAGGSGGVAASSADSAPASGGRRPHASGRAAAAEAADADTAAAPAAGEQVPLELAAPGYVLRGAAGKDGYGAYPVRRAAPAVLRLQARTAAPAAAAAAAAAAGAAAAGESREHGMSFRDMFLGPAGAVDSVVQAQQGAGQQRRGRDERKYLDVNAYMQSGDKVVTVEACNPLAAASAAAGEAEGAWRTSRTQLGDFPGTSSVSRTLQGTSPGGLSDGLTGVPPLAAAAGNGSNAGATPPGGWPGAGRDTDMFSWLQQQMQGQQLQPGGGQPSPGSGGGSALQEQQQGFGLDLSTAGYNSPSAAAADAANKEALQALARAIQQQVGQAPPRSAAGAAAANAAQPAAATAGGAEAGTGRSTGDGVAGAARESSTQVPMLLLRQPGSGSAPPGSKQGGAMGPASPKASLAAAAAAAGGSPLRQLLLQQGRGDVLQQPRSPGSCKVRPDAAALMSHLPEALAQAGKPGTAAAAAAAAAASAAAVLPRMSEYFGCVTSVPQLSPGEVRAAGVTAHPNVVATFVRQRDAATMQALQPWSVVVPPASQQQLAACGVQPSSIATQLRTLLHASNVLNNHLIDATSAPSGSAAAALLQDQQSAGAGLSGGYAGMPQDLPVRYVRGGFVGADDPRRLLQGEFTLTALQDLEPGTVLGPWRSYALTQQDYAVLMNSPPAGWQAPPGMTRDTAWLELLHKYTLTLHVPALEGADPAGTACSHTAHTLYFCALGHGNLTCLANDPLIDPLSAAAASISSGAASLTAAAASASSAWDAAHHPRIGPPNVNVDVVLVNGLPLPLLVTTRQLQAGDQVCYSYGAAYWHAWAGIRAHILKEQHGAAAGAGAAAAAHGAKGGRQTQGLML